MAAAPDIVAELLTELRAETERLDRIDRYVRGDHDGPYMPRTASREYRLLATRAVTNLIPLIAGSIAQALYVDGYRHSDGSTASAWRWWQANGLDARQSGVHRAMLTYGLAYVTVLPGDALDDVAGRAPVIRGVSPRRMHARYDDPAEDEWPVEAVRAERVTLDGAPRLKVRYYDDQAVTEFHADTDGANLVEVETVEHGAGVCPVIAFRDLPDLEGRSVGQVEPHIALQDRLNQTIFDLLVAQSFSSFKVRTVTGLTPKLDADGKPVPIPIDARRLLMAADPDTRFGQLDETDLRPLLDSADAIMRHMAVASQTPPQDLLGNLANLSAEALTAARDGHTRKKSEEQTTTGEAWEQTLRLASRIAGDETAWTDTAAQVSWRDTDGHSLSLLADALGKLASMLEVPVEGLWPRIPGTTSTDIENWQRLRAAAKASDPMRMLADHVNTAATADAGVDGGSVSDSDSGDGRPPP